MKSKKAILMLIAGTVCCASGAILHIWTENMWSYILYIPGLILINLASKKEAQEQIKVINLGDDVNSLMKKLLYKPLLTVIISIVCVVSAAYLIFPGFTKEYMIYIGDYTVSEDGQEMTIRAGVTSSVGYIRKVKHYQIDGQCYLEFYNAFEGINGSIGAKNEFKIPLYENTESIVVCTGKDTYELALEKDADGEWERSTVENEK